MQRLSQPALLLLCLISAISTQAKDGILFCCYVTSNAFPPTILWVGLDLLLLFCLTWCSQSYSSGWIKLCSARGIPSSEGPSPMPLTTQQSSLYLVSIRYKTLKETETERGTQLRQTDLVISHFAASKQRPVQARSAKTENQTSITTSTQQRFSKIPLSPRADL